MTVCASCGHESATPFRFCPRCGAPASDGARELRKTVTVLFSDLVDSTGLGEQLDAESLRVVLARYFDEVRAVLERHGGRVEKFIGDAVVALFGVPAAREDDALRALRAAAEIAERLDALNESLEREYGVRLAVRTGIDTGEIVVGDADTGGVTASGDTMNVAARLEQAAAAGEVLIGGATRILGGDAIEVEELEPLELRGKAEPVEAYRLVRVLPDASPYGRRDDAPLVGRRRELALLHDALRRAVETRSCVLATIVGSAGAGKSRLTREFLSTLDDVEVLVGRCVAYGEGVTFLPIADALERVLGADPRARAIELMAGDPQAEAVGEGVSSMLGTGDASTTNEEVFWAVRRLLEVEARERPLVFVADDLHWAEPTLLDLLEYVATFSSGSPILIVALSRPELLEERPDWATPRENAIVTVLAPLDDEETSALAGFLAGEKLDEVDVRRLVEAADGNPLFLEQLLALNLGRESSDELVVPPTIQALLAARVDRLEPAERLVLECASVEGRQFRRALLAELVPASGRDAIGSILLALARKQFIRPARGGAPDGAFAFVHGLMRDAAYAGIPKAVRADLHLRLADLIARDSGVAGTADIAAHHLEDAVRYRRELGLDDDETRAIASRAVEQLAASGSRALATGDDRLAARLLERASELVPEGDPSTPLVRIELGRALAGAGELDRARDVFLVLRASARETGERGLELRAELGLANLRAQTDVTVLMSELVELADAARPVFEEQGDERGLARAWYLVHWARFRTGRFADAMEALEHVVEHSRRAHDPREQVRALGQIAMACLWGPTPAEGGLRVVDSLVERAGGARLMEAFAERVRGGFCALTGDFETGRQRCRQAIEIYEELGHPISAIGVSSELQLIERQAGRPDAAERVLRDAYARFVDLGDLGYVSWVAPALARLLAERGHHDEALELARVCREELQRDHAYAQVASRLAVAAVYRAQARLEEATTTALEAHDLVQRTDMIHLQAETLALLAELELDAGNETAARERFAAALATFERKGDVVSAARIRDRA